MIVVVAGLAGAGKTELLRRLPGRGEQVLDLEALASHRGSAFGGIGLPPQPSHAQFARAVRGRLRAADPRRVLWVEDEGPFLGSVGVPPELMRAIATAPVVEIEAPFAERVARIEATYGQADPALLVEGLARSRRRLGFRHTDDATALVRRGDLGAAIELVLPYFDAAYRHRTAAYRRRVITRVHASRAITASSVSSIPVGKPRPCASSSAR